MSKVDYLTEDNFLPVDQKFVCISFLSDKDNKSSLVGVKIRGVFPTYELACDHAKKVQTIDSNFNVFVGDMGKWLPFDPAPDSVKTSEYANEQLNTMMKSYLENQEKAKIFHEQRKTELVRQTVLDNLTSKTDSLNEIKSKLEGITDVKEMTSLEENITFIESQIKDIEDKKKELDEQIKNFDTQVKSFESKPAPIKIIDV